jgi:hypothetical protein
LPKKIKPSANRKTLVIAHIPRNVTAPPLARSRPSGA